MSRMTNKTGMAGLAACALCAMGGMATSVNAEERGPAAVAQAGKPVAPESQGFYCNVKALTAAERARYKELTGKLLAGRAEIVEVEKGYELRYRGGSIALAEVAEWVTMESKCCPFFDFHIDLEEEGRLVCLRLTGRDGVKTFIRAEFGI